MVNTNHGIKSTNASSVSDSLHRNFELPRVKSINTSGHKFGLVYAGVGWIIWRDEVYLPKHLVFELHYLGGTEESYTLNFSRPGAQIIGQYFNLIHLGFEGFRSIMENCLTNARLLSKALEASGWYICVSDIHRKKGEFSFKGVQETVFKGKTSADYNAGLPVVAFRLSDQFKKDHPQIKQQSVSTLLRAKQYIVPSKLSFCVLVSLYAYARKTTLYLLRRRVPRSCESSYENPCLWTFLIVSLVIFTQ